MSTYLRHIFIYIYIHILSVNISTYVYDEHTPKFRCFKTRVNVSTSHFRIYIFSRTISLRINVCQQRIYPEISMFKNNCQRIYVTFSYIYKFTYYLSTYQRMSTMNIPQNFYVLKRVTPKFKEIITCQHIYIIPWKSLLLK